MGSELELEWPNRTADPTSIHPTIRAAGQGQGIAYLCAVQKTEIGQSSELAHIVAGWKHATTATTADLPMLMGFEGLGGQLKKISGGSCKRYSTSVEGFRFR